MSALCATLHAQEKAELSEPKSRGPIDAPALTSVRSIWLELTAGGAVVTADRFTRDRAAFEIEPRPRSSRARQLPATQCQTLERLLSGESAKVVALESGCAQSTIAARARLGLRHLGLDCTYSAAPVLLIGLVHVVCMRIQPRWLQIEPIGERGLRASAERPDVDLEARLSPSEAAVARLRVEGLDYDAIAARRGTTVRTVANQLARVYEKLGTAGRVGLISRLLVCRHGN